MQFLAFSNLWIAFAALTHVFTTFLLLHEKTNYFSLFFVFCSTLFIYNFLRIIKLKAISADSHSEQLKWVNKHLYWITIITLVGFIGLMICFFFLSRSQQLIAMASGIIAIGYNVQIPFINFSLRNIPFTKDLWIALIWTIATLILPLSINEFVFPEKIFLLRFLFIYALIIPFDIRDLKYDAPKMKTLPQVLGINGAVFFGCILMLTCMCLAFDIFKNGGAIPLSISYLLTAFVFLFSLKERKELFYPIVVDGMIVVQMGLVGFFAPL